VHGTHEESSLEQLCFQLNKEDHRGDLVAWPVFTEHRRGLIDKMEEVAGWTAYLLSCASSIMEQARFA
jgi:hypothetical protein